MTIRFILGFLIGAMLGASIAIALASPEGAEARQQILEKIRQQTGGLDDGAD